MTQAKQGRPINGGTPKLNPMAVAIYAYPRKSRPISNVTVSFGRDLVATLKLKAGDRVEVLQNKKQGQIRLEVFKIGLPTAGYKLTKFTARSLKLKFDPGGLKTRDGKPHSLEEVSCRRKGDGVVLTLPSWVIEL